MLCSATQTMYACVWTCRWMILPDTDCNPTGQSRHACKTCKNGVHTCHGHSTALAPSLATAMHSTGARRHLNTVNALRLLVFWRSASLNELEDHTLQAPTAGASFVTISEVTVPTDLRPHSLCISGTRHRLLPAGFGQLALEHIAGRYSYHTHP